MSSTWILILLVRSLSTIAFTNITGFKNAGDCIKAGNETKALVSGTTKELAFVCVEQQRN